MQQSINRVSMRLFVVTGLFVVGLFSVVILNFSFPITVYASQTTFKSSPMGKVYVTLNKNTFSPGEVVRVKAGYALQYMADVFLTEFSIEKPKFITLAGLSQNGYYDRSSGSTSFRAPTVPGTYKIPFTVFYITETQGAGSEFAGTFVLKFNVAYTVVAPSSGSGTNSSVLVNGTCSPTHYVCTNGTSVNDVNGSASWAWVCRGSNGGSNATCSEAKSTCSLPWGGTTPSGTSVTAYRTTTVTSPATCTSVFQSQTRTCNNGSLPLSSRYTKGSCTVNHPPVISFNSSNKTIFLGQSITYSSSATDSDGNMDYLALNWKNPDGTYNWSGGQSSYQANVSSGPYFHYVPSRDNGSYSISFKPSSLGTYKIYSVAHDSTGWVYSASSYALRVVSIPTATLSVAPSTISSGQSTQISWSSTNAASCTSTGGFSTGGRTAGSVSSGPLTTSTQYQIYCYGIGGRSARTYSRAKSVTILVPEGTLSVYPTRVEEGKSTPIKFTIKLKNVKNTDTCAVNKHSTSIQMPTDRAFILGHNVMRINRALFPLTHGGISTTTATSEIITTQTKYYLECNGVPVSNSVIVNVVPTFNNF